MTLSQYLKISLKQFTSEASQQTPKKNFPLVGGVCGVTSELPTLQDILDWQEGLCELEHGYYRFVDHPYIETIQQALQQSYQLRHSLCYTSFKTALFELLDYLLLSKPEMTLHILKDESPEWWSSLEILHTHLRTLSKDEVLEPEAFSRNKDEIFLIALPFAENWIVQNQEFLQQLKKRRVPVVVVSEELPPFSADLSIPHYWVSSLTTPSSSLQGGILLSNADRQMAELKELRKQRGPVLSIQDAQAFVEDAIPSLSEDLRTQTHQALCQIEQANFGFLYPSGMNAISTLMHYLRTPSKSQIIAIGHLYTDTYSLLTYGKLRHGDVENIFLGTDEIENLASTITSETAAIITETITNPLNDVPDLEAITAIAKQHGIPVIVDNTFATPYNCNPLVLGADYVIHSTTKYLSGANDHAGGVILLNSEESALQLEKSQNHIGNQMSLQECSTLQAHLNDFEERMGRFNKNAHKVAEFLENHPAVGHVYFNGLPSHPNYETAKKLLRDASSVVSFVLKQETLEALRIFYDTDLSPIIKAPSLGANQTLLCPYTLLAHYHEPDELLEELHMSRYLIRVSVGSEESIAPVIDGLNKGLEAVLSNG